MKKPFTILLLIFLCKFSFAQNTFQRVYPSTNPVIPLNFVNTLDGNYLIYGSAFNGGNNIVNFFKIDSNGDSLWSKAYIYPGFGLNRLIELQDSGFAIIGSQNEYSVIIKYDKNGDSLWSKQYTYQTSFGRSSWGLSLLETDDHGFFVVNTHNDTDIVYYDIQFQRLDSLGNQIWARDYNFGHDIITLGYIIETSNNNYLVQVRVSEGGPNIPYGTLLSVDSAGNMTNLGYTFETGTIGGDFISRGNDGNFIIVGNTKDNWDDYGYGTLKKITPGGTSIWDNTFPQTSRTKSVSSTIDNGCIVACDSFVNPDVREFQLKRFDANGSLLWSNTYPINHHESASSVKQTTDGGYLAVGYHEQFFRYETYIIKTDSTGNVNTNGYTITSNNLSPCMGDTVTLATQHAASYLWSDGSTGNSIDVTRNGSYNVRVSDSTGAVYFTSFYDVTFKLRPELTLGNDTLICFAQTLLLDAGSGLTDYQWHDGSTGQTFSISGNVQDLVLCSVQITDTLGCKNSDTIQVVIDVCNGINSQGGENTFSLDPNPFHESLFLRSLNSTNENFMISIFNGLGEKVFQKQMNFMEEEINLSSLKKGFYYITLKSEMSIFSRRIVKL